MVTIYVTIMSFIQFFFKCTYLVKLLGPTAYSDGNEYWNEKDMEGGSLILIYIMKACLEGLSKTIYNSVMCVHVPGEMRTEAFSNTSYRFRYLSRSSRLFLPSLRSFLSS
jgi:hypothetical protein